MRDTESLVSFLSTIDSSKKRWAETIQAETTRLIEERQAGIDLLVQGIHKLVNAKVHIDYAKLSAAINSDIPEPSPSLPNHGPPMGGPETTTVHVDKGTVKTASEKKIAKLQKQLAILKSQLADKDDVIQYKDSAIYALFDKYEAATACIEIMAAGQADQDQPIAQPNLVPRESMEPFDLGMGIPQSAQEPLVDSAAKEVAKAKKEMVHIVKSYPVGMRGVLRSAMNKILYSKAPSKLEDVPWTPWVIKHPWELTPEGSGKCSETTVGGLMLHLYELVGLAGTGYVPLADALDVVEQLMSAIPNSTFHQVSRGYGMVWEALGQARFKSSELRILFLWSMLALGALIAARFKNLRTPWPGMEEFTGPNDDNLVAALMQTMLISGHVDHIEQTLSTMFNEDFRRFRIPDLDQDIGILADHHHDYVLVIDFAMGTILLAHKCYGSAEATIFSPWEGGTRDLRLKSPLDTASSIYIAVPCEEDVDWWSSRLEGWPHWD